VLGLSSVKRFAIVLAVTSNHSDCLVYKDVGIISCMEVKIKSLKKGRFYDNFWLVRTFL